MEPSAQVKAIGKRFLRGALRKLPGKPALVRAAALAPSALKTLPVCRALTRVFEAEELARLGRVRTNLGLSMPRVAIDGTAPPYFFFGTPEAAAGERGALELAAWLSRHCDAFLDIGANHGYFVYYVHHALAGAVPIHYFEPVPALFEEIDENVARLGLRAVHGHRLAVGAATGEATFYLNLSDTTSSSLSPAFATKHRLQEIDVQVTTFDDFAETHGIERACLKVDIENAEHAFLAGATRNHRRIAYLIIEVLGPAIKAGFIRTACAQLGMHAYYIDDRTLRPSRAGEYTYRPPEYNWLLCHEPPDALRARLAGSRLRVAQE